MLPEEEIVRVCSLIVATATGVDPLAHVETRRGNDQLQYARALWVHLVVCEMNVSRGRASFLCNRSFESIERNLAEVEEWRSDATFSDKLDRWAEGAKSLTAMVFDYARICPPPPTLRARQLARVAVNERAVAA